MRNEVSTLFSKLAQYSALALPAMLSIKSTDAQVFYQDVNPDKILDANNEKQKIDLNNDGNFDFVLRHFINATSGNLHRNDIMILPYFSLYSVNAIAGVLITSPVFPTSSDFLYPLALSGSNMIDANIPWYTKSDLHLIYGSASSLFYFPLMAMHSFSTGGNAGYWLGAVDKFLPLRVDDGINHYYGWARCDVASDGTSMTLKDYAMETTPGLGIHASIPLSSNPAVNAKDVIIFAFDKTLMVSFNSPNLSSAILQVFSVTGQEVLSENITSANNVISLGQLAAGNYMVKLNYDGKVATKKVAI